MKASATKGGACARRMAPAETTARLNRAFVEAIESSEIRARLASLFAEPMSGSPERFAAFVRSELAKYERVVKASGARVE